MSSVANAHSFSTLLENDLEPEPSAAAETIDFTDKKHCDSAVVGYSLDITTNNPEQVGEALGIHGIDLGWTTN